MRRMLLLVAAVGTFMPGTAWCQVKTSREQVLFYTAEWKGARFPDGRPRLPDDLLARARSMTIEDIWDFLRDHGYENQFVGDLQALHPDQPFAGRALTAQYMPLRPDMARAIEQEGKSEKRVGDTNSWPIADLENGDVYVADGFGKIAQGTLIGSNLGNAVAARSHVGFVFYAGIRDQAENREIPGLNGMYLGYDPSDWAQMELTAIDAPIRLGRAVVLPGDLVVAQPREGVIFIPAILAEQAISSSEFTALKDAYNFHLNQQGRNGARFEGGWTREKYDDFSRWVAAHPEMRKMPRSEFDSLLAAESRQTRPNPAPGARQP